MFMFLGNVILTVVYLLNDVFTAWMSTSGQQLTFVVSDVDLGLILKVNTRNSIYSTADDT